MLTLIALCALTFAPFDRSCVLPDAGVIQVQTDDPPPGTYCANDPGDHWDYEHDREYGMFRTCDGPMTDAQVECIYNAVGVFYDAIDDANTTWRKATCDCYKNHPYPDPGFADCILNANYWYTLRRDTAKTNLLIDISICCPANP